MRNIFSSIIIFTFLICIFAASCSNQTANISSSPTQESTTPGSKYIITFPAPAGNIPNVRLELPTSKFDLPDKLTIYKMVKPQITTEYVASLETKFGLIGEINQGDDGFSIQDNKTGATLEIYKATGTIVYSVDSKLYPEEKPTLPSDEEAKKIAMDFLTERGLLPEGDVASKVYTGSSSGYGPAHLLVGFTHVVSITGPGAKHGVRIGNNGEVIEVFINPTNPLKLPVQEITSRKSITQSCQDLQTSKNYLAPLDTKKVIITKVTIAYWLEPIDKGQEYVIPVYSFSGQCFDRFDKLLDGNFSGYAQAVN